MMDWQAQQQLEEQEQYLLLNNDDKLTKIEKLDKKSLLKSNRKIGKLICLIKRQENKAN